MIVANGGESRFGVGVSREIHAQCSLSQTSGLEQIGMILRVNFNGQGLNHEATYLGIYARSPSDKKFVLRFAKSDLNGRTMLSTKDFEELADPFSGIPNEKLLDLLRKP